VTDKIVVLSTCESEHEAKRVAKHLLENQLAACVNILPGATSIFRWKDKIEEVAEYVLLIKSRRDLFPALSIELQKVHSYETPEVIALPILEGSERYIAWLNSELETGRNENA
jgi:periplasmic divalent cation tolerance protein